MSRNLSLPVVEGIDLNIKAQRGAGSQTAALREKIDRTKREGRRLALEQASQDPMFLADIGEIERDFEHADTEASPATSTLNE